MPGICCGLWVFFVPSWQARFPSNLSYARALVVEVARAVAKQADGLFCLRKGNWSDCRKRLSSLVGLERIRDGKRGHRDCSMPHPPRFTSTRYLAPVCCARLDGRGLERLAWLGYIPTSQGPGLGWWRLSDDANPSLKPLPSIERCVCACVSPLLLIVDPLFPCEQPLILCLFLPSLS